MPRDEGSERRLSRALIFYKDDIDRIERALESYQGSSKSQCNILLDRDGHLVTQVGALEGVDLRTVAALLAGSFAATCEIARVLGEEEFTSLAHQGKDESIQLTLIGDRTILATVYSQQTSAGLVRFYLSSVVLALGKILETVTGRPRHAGLGAGFDEELGGAFEGLFGTEGG